MDTNPSFVKRNSLLIFFIIAYGLSWGSFFLLDGPFFFPIGALVAAFIVAGFTGGLRARRTLPTICRYRCSVSRVGRHAASGSSGQSSGCMS